jgi:hypothetical protein
MNSAEFKKLRGTTPNTRRPILESTWKEPIRPDANGVFGDMPIAKMTSQAIRVLRDRKSDFKTAANDRRKVIGYVFAWGMEAHPKIVLANPTRDVSRLKHKVINIPPWTEAHFQVFMGNIRPALKNAGRWRSISTRAHVVVTFGILVRSTRVMVALSLQKTGGDVDVPVLEELARELALTPKDALAFILIEYGRTFSQKGYGNWFNEKCRNAGLADRTAHGIRGGAATHCGKQRRERPPANEHVWMAR